METTATFNAKNMKKVIAIPSENPGGLDAGLGAHLWVPQGCVYTVACASAMSALATGCSIEQALKLQPEDVANELGGLPADHLHCARLAINTLGEAIAEHDRKAFAIRQGKGDENPNTTQS